MDHRSAAFRPAFAFPELLDDLLGRRFTLVHNSWDPQCAIQLVRECMERSVNALRFALYVAYGLPKGIDAPQQPDRTNK